MSSISATDERQILDEKELDHLHTEDLHAGRIVVGLISGVFVTGLLLYAAIWCIVWMG